MQQLCAAGTLYVQVHEAKDLPAAPLLRVTFWRAFMLTSPSAQYLPEAPIWMGGGHNDITTRVLQGCSPEQGLRGCVLRLMCKKPEPQPCALL